MSRRFGRNQRRRAREEIARLSEAHARDSTLARHLNRAVSDLREEIDDAKRMVGQHCAMFAPMLVRSSQLPRRSWDVPLVPEIPSGPSAYDPMQTFELMPLNVMLTKVERRTFDRSIHVRVEFRDGTWGYAVSDSVLNDMRADPKMLVRHISRTLAHEVGRAILGLPARADLST